MKDDTTRIRALETNQLFDIKNTIASGYLSGFLYPYEALKGIGTYILQLGETLSTAKFDKKGKDVWIAKSAKVAPTACINGPCIIDEGAEIRHCAFIRGSAIIGKNAVVGNSTEIKNSILFDEAKAPHFNYVGDSILGYKAHMGAGSITSNVKSDSSYIEIHYGTQKHKTGLIKFGALLGDRAEIGCNTVMNPGSIIGRDATVYPLSSVRGYVPNKSLCKTVGKPMIVPKRLEESSRKKYYGDKS